MYRNGCAAIATGLQFYSTAKMTTKLLVPVVIFYGLRCRNHDRLTAQGGIGFFRFLFFIIGHAAGGESRILTKAGYAVDSSFRLRCFFPRIQRLPFPPRKASLHLRIVSRYKNSKSASCQSVCTNTASPALSMPVRSFLLQIALRRKKQRGRVFAVRRFCFQPAFVCSCAKIPAAMAAAIFCCPAEEDRNAPSTSLDK